MQRQTVYFGAKLDEKFWHFGSLKSDERRLSLPRITSSDSEDDADASKDRNVAVVQNRLVRSVPLLCL